MSSKDLQEFLTNRVERFSTQDISQVNFLSDKSIAFDVPERYKKRLTEVIIDLEKKENILDSIYRLRTITNQEMLKNFSQYQIDFTVEEYENAMHHQDWEVYVRGLGQDVDEDTIVRLFKNNQVKIIQVKLPRDNEGIPQGYAFVLCLNET